MPNWCNNSVEIVGPRDKIRALWAQAQKDEAEGGGLLQGMRPMPEGLRSETAPAPDDLAERNQALYGAPDWYSWRTTNWSTKWEVSIEGLEFEEDDDSYDRPFARITGWFDSAWAPPCSAFEFYAEQNPDVRLTLDYHESGMGFVGRSEFTDGAMISDEYYEYCGATSKDVRGLIGDDMDDMWNISEQMAEYEAENRDEFQEWYEDGVEKLNAKEQQ